MYSGKFRILKIPSIDKSTRRVCPCQLRVRKANRKHGCPCLTTENLEDAERWIREYPWLEEIYQEIAVLRRKPEEVLGMWSEALRMLDENSLKYYVDELREQVKVAEEKAEEERKKAEEERKKAEEERKKAEEERKKAEEEKKKAEEERKKIEEEKKKAKEEKDVLLQERNSALAEKDAEIEALKKQLAKLKENT